MKRLAVALGVSAALAVPSATLAAGTLPGTYKAKVPSGQLKGTVTLKFTAGHKYTVLLDGGLVAAGKDTLSGSTITFHDTPGTPGACAKPGTYRYALSAGKLRFTRINDPACSGRVEVLAQAFSKAG